MWVEKLCLPTLYVLSNLEGQAYVRVFKDIFNRKDESNIKVEKKLMKLPFPYTVPVFSSFVKKRRKRLPWYLTSCLQFCDNVHIAFLG